MENNKVRKNKRQVPYLFFLTTIRLVSLLVLYAWYMADKEYLCRVDFISQ